MQLPYVCTTRNLYIQLNLSHISRIYIRSVANLNTKTLLQSNKLLNFAMLFLVNLA